MIRDRYLVPAEGKDLDALVKALQFAVRMAKKNDFTVTLVVPALKRAEGSLLKHVFSEAQLKRLRKGETLLIDKNVKTTMASMFTVHNTNSEVLVALFASKEMIQKVENSQYCEVLIVLPWAGDGDTTEWQGEWSPVVLKSGTKT